MKRWSKYIVGAFIVIGSCIGSVVSIEFLDMDQDVGILLGMLLGFLATLLVPSLWKSFLETVQTEHNETVEQKRYLGFREAITHPTNLPAIIGGAWMFACIIILAIFDPDVAQKPALTVSIVPFLLSIGVSGLAMIRTRELMVSGWFGYVIKKTNWTIVLGSALILFGFGGSIYSIFALIFDW